MRNKKKNEKKIHLDSLKLRKIYFDLDFLNNTTTFAHDFLSKTV